MPSQKLSKAPLVEAIFEIRWKLANVPPGVLVDPKYKVLVGRLFDRLESQYPNHEPLPSASMPDEMFAYVVQHRFHSKEGKWPLVQVGPGVVTLNQTENYTWDDFEQRATQLQKALVEAYPDAQRSLTINRLQLRYIDAMPLDFEKCDVLDVIKESLKINIALPPNIFEGAPINKAPLGLQMLLAFPTTDPKGALQLQLSRSDVKGKPMLVWETIVQSEDEDVPEIPSAFPAWLSAAHALTHDLFFKMIEGSLEETFR